MKEFVDKLKSRLEEEHEGFINRYGIVGGNIPASIVKNCMNIVNQLAEEYINCSTDTSTKSTDCSTKVSEMPTGWIPCSERLPDDFMSFEYLTIRKGHTLATITYYCVANHKWYSNRNSTREIEVIAWQPLPAPYMKGE